LKIVYYKYFIVFNQSVVYLKLRHDISSFRDDKALSTWIDCDDEHNTDNDSNKCGG